MKKLLISLIQKNSARALAMTLTTLFFFSVQFDLSGQVLTRVFDNQSTEPIELLVDGKVIATIPALTAKPVDVNFRDRIDVNVPNKEDWTWYPIFINEIEDRGKIKILPRVPFDRVSWAERGGRAEATFFEQNVNGVHVNDYDPFVIFRSFKSTRIFAGIHADCLDYEKYSGGEFLTDGFLTNGPTPYATGDKKATFVVGEDNFKSYFSTGAEASIPLGGSGVNLDLGYNYSKSMDQNIKESSFSFVKVKSKSIINIFIDKIDRVRLSKDFTDAVEEVLKTGSAENLIKNYGTHYPVSVDYGGYYRSYISIEESAYRKAEQEGWDVSVGVSAAMDATEVKETGGKNYDDETTTKSGGEAVGGKISAAGGTSRDVSNLINNSHSHYVYVGGEGGFNDWNLTKENSGAIAVELNEIYHLIYPHIMKTAWTKTECDAAREIIKDYVEGIFKDIKMKPLSKVQKRVFKIKVNNFLKVDEIDDFNKRMKGNISVIVNGQTIPLWSSNSAMDMWKDGPNYLAQNKWEVISQESDADGNFAPIKFSFSGMLYEHDGVNDGYEVKMPLKGINGSKNPNEVVNLEKIKGVNEYKVRFRHDHWGKFVVDAVIKVRASSGFEDKFESEDEKAITNIRSAQNSQDNYSPNLKVTPVTIGKKIDDVETTLSIPDGMAKEVKFHGQNGITMDQAKAIAAKNGWKIASSYDVQAAFQKHNLDVYAFGMMADGRFAVPVQKDHSNFKKGPNIGAVGGNQGFFYTQLYTSPVKEVKFHGKNGVTIADALAIASQKGWKIATNNEVMGAFYEKNLDVYAFGMMADGRFAVPVQKDHSNFKKGPNIGATGGNQGFFYTMSEKTPTTTATTTTTTSTTTTSTPTTTTNMSKDGLFDLNGTYYITDAKHKGSLLASSGGGVVHNSLPYNSPASTFNWYFMPTGDGYYYIYNLQANKAVVGADNYYSGQQSYNNVVLKAPDAKTNAQWKIVPTDKEGQYIITDRKHGFSFFTRDNNNNNAVSHQPHDNQPNAYWTFTVTDTKAPTNKPDPTIITEKPQAPPPPPPTKEAPNPSWFDNNKTWVDNEYIGIQNKAKNTHYIHLSDGQIKEGPVKADLFNAQWKFILVPYRGKDIGVFQNRSDSELYLLFSYGKLVAKKGTFNSMKDYAKALWKIAPSKEAGWVYIKYKDTGGNLFIENNHLLIGTIKGDEGNGLWKLEGATATTTTSATTTSVSNTMNPASPGSVRILSFMGKNNYLHNQNNNLEASQIQSDWPSGQWKLVPAEGDLYRIESSVQSGQYLYNKDGKLELGKVDSNSPSALWKLTPAQQGVIRIQNSLDPDQYMLTQGKKVAIGTVDFTQYSGPVMSSMWKIEGEIPTYVATTTTTPATTTTVSNTMNPASPGSVRIQNYWKKAHFVHNQNGKLEDGSIQTGWLGSEWKIVPVHSGWVRIQNQLNPDQYLHTQNGKIEVGTIDPNWASAMWKLIPAKPGWVRIQNSWNKDFYLHNQNGKIEAGKIETSWASALWKVE